MKGPTSRKEREKWGTQNPGLDTTLGTDNGSPEGIPSGWNDCLKSHRA